MKASDTISILDGYRAVKGAEGELRAQLEDALLQVSWLRQRLAQEEAAREASERSEAATLERLASALDALDVERERRKEAERVAVAATTRAHGLQLRLLVA